MAKLQIFDEAREFRIEIDGRFAGEVVHRVHEHWAAVLRETSGRRFTVDISALMGYDSAGYKLLRKLYRHGTYLSARNAVSLTFLNEISQPEPAGPTLIYPRKPNSEGGSSAVTSIEQQRRAVAAK